MKNAFSVGMNLPLLRFRSFSVTTSGTPGTATSLNFPTISASSLTRSGTTATFTATAAHHLADGQFVTIAGADNDQYNGVKQITVTGATTFTYTLPSDPGANASGTITATCSPHAQWALIVSDGNNDSAGVTFGPDVNADFDTVSPAQAYALPCPSGGKFNLADWYVKSSVASQVLRVLFV